MWNHLRRIAALRPVLGLSLAVALTSACGGTAVPPTTPGADGAQGGAGAAAIDKPAPDLSIQTLNGKGSVSLASLQGKIAIVDFWATWCKPCEKSFPTLENFAKQNPDKVTVVGISADDKKDGVAEWAKAKGASFAIGWDDGHEIAKRWKVDKMPTTYILDASGTVRFVHEGYHDDEADLIQRELALLSSEPPPSSSAPANAVASSSSSDGAKAADASSSDSSSDASADAPAPPAKAGHGKKGAGKPRSKPAVGQKKTTQKKKKG